MNEKVCIVTGASSGIGKASAAGLASLGATVVAAMRGPSPRSDAALAEIRAKSRGPSDSVSAMYADLSSQDSIREFALEFNEKFDSLEVLINNAAVYRSRRVLTVDGIEMTFAVNVVAPFLITNLLLDKLKRSTPSRIVNVSSDAANGHSVDFQNLQGERKYSMLSAYGLSKLELDLITLEFARRLEGTGVTANFLHPGVIRTNLYRDGNPVAMALFSLVRLFFGSPENGARTPVYLASSPDLEGVTGRYFSGMREQKAWKEAYDLGSAKRLWQICERITEPRKDASMAPSKKD